MPRKALPALLSLWLGWFAVLYGFQWLVTARLGIARPDLAVLWSPTETMANSNRGKIYLLEPFMNDQVAWDSEYYVGIAVAGYDDPRAGTAVINPRTGERLIKNYSFFPLYPYLMRLVRQPLAWLGMQPIPSAVAAGLLVALLGTLAGLFALWQLAAGILGEEASFRAVSYMLLFPTAFFFAMVYTEGLFVGLAFNSLLLSRRGRWLGASLLGMLAAWTRAHGAILALPLLIAWWGDPGRSDRRHGRKEAVWWLQGLMSLLPVGAYLLWRASPLGQGWAALQPFYFGRGFLWLPASLQNLVTVFQYAQSNSQAAVYFTMEAAAILLALAAGSWLLKRDRSVALFSLAAVLFSLFSGSMQSMARYVLVAPALYLFLAYLGRSASLDRVWTIASVLLLGVSSMLFAFDMWVG